MEKYWEIVSRVSGLARIGVIGYLFYRFVKPYLSKKCLAKAVGAVYFAVMVVLYLFPWETDGMVAYGIGALTAFFVMCFVDGRNRKQKLFLAVTMYLLEWAASGVAGLPRSIIFEGMIYQPYVQKRIWLQLVCFAITEIFYGVLFFLLLAVLVKVVNKVYVNKRENMSGKELALMLATPVLIFTGYWAFLFFSNAWLGTFEHYIWNVYSQYLWIKAAYQAASYLAVVTTIILYQSIREGHQKEKENAVLAGQMADMKRHIGQLESVYKDIRGLKHDINHHILTMEALLHRNEHRQAEEYLQRFKERIGEAEGELKTGNPVTDVILTEKRKEAQKRGIDFLCDFHYPRDTKINAFDISVILNNGIDNAMEAVTNAVPEMSGQGDHPYIHIKSWRQKNAYMIEIRNPFSGSLFIDDESGLPESTKNGQEHGFGLLNIQKVAHQYSGEIDVLQEENLFVLSVMLMAE